MGSTPNCPSTFHSMSVEVITTLASESARMCATSLSPSRKMTGTMTAPHLRIAAVALDHLGAVREHHHDAIARGHAQAPQGVREPGGGALLVQVGVLPPLEREGDVLTVLVEAVLGQAR